MPPRDLFEATAEQILEMFRETNDATDRVAAISCVAFLDESLAAALAARFVPLGKEWEGRLFSGPMAPLGTLSAKIRLGYALGLYGPMTCKDLDIVRDIRNLFAHTAGPIAFEDETIRKKCSSLTSPERFAKVAMSLTAPFDLSIPRARFTYSARQIALELIIRFRGRPPRLGPAPQRPLPPDALP